MDNKEIDALVQMLDSQITGGTKHVNVKVNGTTGNIELDKVTIESGVDCDSENSACKIPNLKLD